MSHPSRRRPRPGTRREPARPGPRRPALVRAADAADVRVRLPRRRPGPLPRRRSASTPLAIGIVLTLTLVGDTLISLWLTTHADRFGRRRGPDRRGAPDGRWPGSSFALTDWLPLLILAATIGVISPTGNEVGPFLAVEQAALIQTVPDARRTATFAWYNLVGYVATATGALAAGLLSQALLGRGLAPVDAYRAVVVGYAVIGARDGHRRSGGSAPPSRRRRATASRRRHPPAPRARSLEGRRAAPVRPVLASTPSAAGSSRRA